MCEFILNYPPSFLRFQTLAKELQHLLPRAALPLLAKPCSPRNPGALMLSLHSVNQFYGERHVLWNVDLEMLSGESVCITGAQGMGKTTLLHCITGHLPVQSGSIVWRHDGLPPQQLQDANTDARAALGIGYVPQDRRIFSGLTVEENLQVALRAAGETQVQVPESVFALFPELYPLRHTRSAALGHESQQQLALANALVIQPKLLILDEPTRGNSAGFIQKLGDILLRLNREFGLSILMVEQQMTFIRRVADRFCLLHKGRSVAQGSVAQLDNPRLLPLIHC